jgi:hypothetical protein
VESLGKGFAFESGVSGIIVAVAVQAREQAPATFRRQRLGHRRQI